MPYLILLILWWTWSNILVIDFEDQKLFKEKEQQEYYANIVSYIIIGFCVFILA